MEMASLVGSNAYGVAFLDYTIAILLAVVFIFVFKSKRVFNFSGVQNVHAFLSFCYTCFLKPHTGDGNGNQQEALESFYRTQAAGYDATRARLLCGREDMLGLVAGQLRHRAQTRSLTRKPIWVDIGGGTGWNIEYMSRFLEVPVYFETVYLVDLSPSLCAIAKSRFERLGWKNVAVVCTDARSFQLEEGADLVTFSYSLSMIPDFYPVVDSMTALLSPAGVVGVCDFYVQNEVEYRNRNYVGGVFNRHCNWLSRIFWRTWFEVDRVNLEPARRDYLEYRFGTILSSNSRNHLLGVQIPYYTWIGCSKYASYSENKLAFLDARATESPQDEQFPLVRVRSKAYEPAVINLSASLPLPAAWYQNHAWRFYYNEHLRKHLTFMNECIYTFTWEDSRVDGRILNIQPSDVVLAITSAGDNVLSLALDRPRHIHAVDLNPTQNHLLELKVAAFTALDREDVWKMFGLGRHENFRDLLITKLSPHLSSLAFQYWLEHGPQTFSGQGLYYTGRSRHALQLVGWLFWVLGMSKEIDKLCTAPTLNEQREVWESSIRRVLLNRLLSSLIIGNEKWLWKVMGVPPAQRRVIEEDARDQPAGHAIYNYVVNTFDPVVCSTLLSMENHYYLLTLKGSYTPQCHPDYLSPRAYDKLSQSTAFDGLRIHTDELQEVIFRMAPKTLTAAVVMDSMDWFSPKGSQAGKQVKALNRVLKVGGRVLLRSAGLSPWYIRIFEERGFTTRRVGARFPGTCIDRVNMYASCWICTKQVDVADG